VVTFNQLGGVLLYGKADEDIPLLQQAKKIPKTKIKKIQAYSDINPRNHENYKNS
jgi:hypothetical protein